MINFRPSLGASNGEKKTCLTPPTVDGRNPANQLIW